MVISDRDVKFTQKFWKSLFVDLERNINFITSYHPETDGQTKEMNQVIEDMLRMYLMERPTKWQDYLYLVEFAYNNGYQALEKMSLFKILHGKKCTTLVNRDSPMDHLIVGLGILQDMEHIVQEVPKNLKVAQDHKKIYTD